MAIPIMAVSFFCIFFRGIYSIFHFDEVKLKYYHSAMSLWLAMNCPYSNSCCSIPHRKAWRKFLDPPSADWNLNWWYNLQKNTIRNTRISRKCSQMLLLLWVLGLISCTSIRVAAAVASQFIQWPVRGATGVLLQPAVLIRALLYRNAFQSPKYLLASWKSYLKLSNPVNSIFCCSSLKQTKCVLQMWSSG